jgi:hypothetical protein
MAVLAETNHGDGKSAAGESTEPAFADLGREATMSERPHTNAGKPTTQISQGMEQITTINPTAQVIQLAGDEAT